MNILTDDGIYFEIFVIKRGKRVNFKIVSLRQLSKILTNRLINSIDEIIEINPPKEE